MVDTPLGGPFPEHTVDTYLKYTVEELKTKRGFLAALIIKPLRSAWKDDPRQPRALEYYLGERELINEALRQKVGEPEPQKIGLKPLTITGKGE